MSQFEAKPKSGTSKPLFENAQAHLAEIVRASSDAIVSKSLDSIVTSWNAAACRTFGYTEDEMVGQSIRRIIPDHLQAEEDMILAKIAAGERLEHYETVRVRKDGRVVNVSVSISPLYDITGKVVGAAKIARDMTERKAHEEKVLLLMREVNHRAKNMLGLVQSMARQTVATRPQDFLARFTDRIHALSANQDLLVKNEWDGVELSELVQAQLATFEDLIGTRIRTCGPRVRLTAAAAQGIGLALHELCTNASKYGALANETGEVVVSWQRDDEAFTLTWVESGGPPVKPPGEKGFGSTIITYAAETSVDGKASLDYAPGGVRWTLTAAVRNVMDTAHAECGNENRTTHA